MTRRKLYIPWPTRLLLGVLTVLITGVVLSGLSMSTPFIPSKRAIDIWALALPFIVFMISLGDALAGNYMAGRYPNQRGYGTRSNPWKFVPGCIFLALLSVLTIGILAIPTKLFADSFASRPVTVEQVSGFRRVYASKTWVYFVPHPHFGGWLANKFMWNRPDLEAQHIQHGDCIMLHGREWALGMYVDSISKSDACASPR